MEEPEAVEEFVHPSEWQRAARAIVLGSVLGAILALVARRRADGPAR